MPFRKPTLLLRTLPFLLSLVALVTLTPVALLLYARWQENRAVRIASDINQSSSLRFRSLWLYGATQKNGDADAEDWPAMLRQMNATRNDLRARYPKAVQATNEAWQAFAGSLQTRGRVDWETANRMRVAADTLTNAINREAQVRNASVSRLLALVTLGLCLSLSLKLFLVGRLRRAQAGIASQNASLDKWNQTLQERQQESARTNELLAQASHRFQELFQGLPVACFCYDAAGRIQEWNRACETLYGWQTYQAMDRTITDLGIWPGDAAQVEALVARVCCGAGEAIEGLEGSVTRASDGSERFVLCNTFPLRRPDGTIGGGISAAVDISERKQAEIEREQVAEALRSGKATLRSFYDSAAAMMGIIELFENEDDVLHVSDNTAAARFFTNGTPDAMRGRRASEMGMPPEIRRLWAGHARKSAASGEPARFEYPHDAPGQAPRWLSASVCSIGTGAGGRARFAYIVEDVTARWQAELALQGSAERLRLLHDVTTRTNAPFEERVDAMLRLGCEQFGVKTAIFARIENGRFQVVRAVSAGDVISNDFVCEADQTLCNEALQRGELLALDCISQSPWRNHPAYAPFWPETYLGTGVHVAGEKFGSLCFTNAERRAEPFSASDQEFLRLMTQWLGFELERQRAETARRRSEERFRAFMDNSPVIASLKDEAGRLLYINQPFEHLFGVTTDAMRGKTDVDWLPEAAARQTGENDQKVFASGQPMETTEALFTPDGAAGHWLVLRFPVNDTATGERFLGTVAIDITARKQAEQELTRQAAELTRSNQELEQFAYVASHDLQEPLRMVASYTQLLSRRYKGKLDDDADEFIHFAVDGAQRMQRLIQDLLAYSRVSTTAREFQPTDCENVLVRALLNLRSAIEESGAVVTHDPLPTLPADEMQMGQLFQNLIGNALKFCRGRVPRVHVSVERQEDGAAWRFGVRDNGIGIAPEYVERIFVIFQRLHSKEEYAGTGIGLAICKKIVERHGGHITVRSAPGEGTTFSFTLTAGRGNDTAGRGDAADDEPQLPALLRAA